MIATVLIEQFIEPGAGLRKLGHAFQDSDLMFDSIFQHGDKNAVVQEPPSPKPGSPVVRMYGSDRDL
jgi:hypothetical protein